jgi:hypothetical protein
MSSLSMGAAFAVRFVRRAACHILSMVCAFMVLAYAGPVCANGVPFKKGDILVTVQQGYGYSWDSKLLHFDPTGTLKDTIDFGTSTKSYLGMAFDASGNLYIAITSTYGVQDGVVKIDSNGNIVGSFGSGYLAPYSILFDKNGDAYVGEDQDAT